jgi:hypothetical protein
MTTLTALSEAMAAHLTDQGIPAQAAWAKTKAAQTEPLVVVQVKKLEATPGGFQNYLGQKYDEETECWRELYGQRAKVTFALDLYSPQETGEEGCRTLLDQAAGALQTGSPAGLALESWTMEGTEYDEKTGLFRGKMSAKCQGALTAETDEDGAFLTFTVKGRVTDEHDT